MIQMKASVLLLVSTIILTCHSTSSAASIATVNDKLHQNQLATTGKNDGDSNNNDDYSLHLINEEEEEHTSPKDDEEYMVSSLFDQVGSGTDKRFNPNKFQMGFGKRFNPNKFQMGFGKRFNPNKFQMGFGKRFNPNKFQMGFGKRFNPNKFQMGFGKRFYQGLAYTGKYHSQMIIGKLCNSDDDGDDGSAIKRWQQMVTVPHRHMNFL